MIYLQLLTKRRRNKIEIYFTTVWESYIQTNEENVQSPYNAVTSKITCSSDSSLEVSKLKGIISKECPITFRCLVRLVTKHFITTLRQRITKGIK